MPQTQHEFVGSNLDVYSSLFEDDDEIEVRDIADSDQALEPLVIQKSVEIQKFYQLKQNDQDIKDGQVQHEDQFKQDGQVQQEDQLKQGSRVIQGAQDEPKLNYKQNTKSRGPRVLKWTLEEDIYLMNYIPRYGKQWAKAARKLNQKLHGGDEIRSGSHCRERWRNHLDPNLNSNS